MTGVKNLSYIIRKATDEDVPVIMDLCRQLSVYEKLEFKATAEQYRRYGFGDEKIFECLLVENKGNTGPAYLGVALYYYTFSTFEGKPTLWLEDIFVPVELRGKGVGTALLKRLCWIAVEKDCGRVEWTVLNWNEPSRKFYINLGAKPLDEWTTFRMTPEIFRKLAES